MPTPDQADAATPAVAREFSDLAVLRGALAAAVTAYILLMLVIPILMSGDPVLALQAAPYALAASLRIESLFIGLTLMSALAIVGLIFLARDKGDYTTYAAAARAGAWTSALACAVVVAVFALPHLAASIFMGNVNVPLPDIVAIGQTAGTIAVTVCTGALAGLAGRLAARAPNVRPEPT